MDKKMCREQFDILGFDVRNLFCRGNFFIKDLSDFSTPKLSDHSRNPIKKAGTNPAL